SSSTFGIPPNIAAGDYYLNVEVDLCNSVVARSKASAPPAQAIHVNKPDLVPTAISAPAAVVTQQSVTIGWTVGNQGTGDTVVGVRGQLYLSTDATYSNDGGGLGFTAHATLAARAMYTSSGTIDIPPKPAACAYLP